MVTGCWTPVNPKRNAGNRQDNSAENLSLLEVAASDISAFDI